MGKKKADTEVTSEVICGGEREERGVRGERKG